MQIVLDARAAHTPVFFDVGPRVGPFSPLLSGLTREVERMLVFKQPTRPYDIESGPGGLTREVEA